MSTSSSENTTAWAVNSCSWRDAARLAQELRVPQVAAMVLAGRGLADPQVAREFIECSSLLPDPFLFSDMQAAVGEVFSAIDAGQRVVVHGDYDADGITATALLVLGLRALGADVDWYLPSRFREGYGLSRTAVETIAAAEAALLLTVDCGVNYPDEVALAGQLGMKVVVVDHHQPGPLLPQCHLIHHVRGDYPHGDLCGVGLALKLLHALHIERLGSERGKLPPALAEMLDLVAVGTVADLVALRGENRQYVREGLRLLNLGQRAGLRALAEVSGCAGAIDAGTVAFRLAPRLNAAGRLSDPSPPLRLLLTDDEHEARALAGQLHEMNGARQDLERFMFEAARAQVDALHSLPTALVLASPEWHEGVAGIVASRVVELYQRPTVLLCVRDGLAKGSGRSIPAYDLLGGLTACGHLLSIFGGHAQAAGLTLPADRLDAFRQALQTHAEASLSAADLIPRYHADAVLSAEELSAETALALASFEPFGSGNPRPRFLLVDTCLENVERTRDGLHVRCQARVGGVKIQAIGFGMGRDGQLDVGQRVSLVGAQLRADEWRGSVRAQLVLERVSPLTPSVASRSDRQWPADTECASDTAKAENALAQEAGGGASGPPGHWPPAARDLRGHPGRLTSLAQLLATGDQAVFLTSSASSTAALLGSLLPREVFDASTAVRIDCASSQSEVDSLAATTPVVVEWEALEAVEKTLQLRSHVIVLDPAYREEQLRCVSKLAEAGAQVHLLYGGPEVRETTKLLRYLVHPRFAMVCLYRAAQDCGADEDGLLTAARRIAWDEGHVVLSRAQLTRARSILKQLGLGRSSEVRAKLDARMNVLYGQAESEYEECVRLCQTL